MTVNELIQELQKIDSTYRDKKILVNGYEGGLEEIKGIEIVKYCENVNKGIWYYGRHEKYHPGYVADQENEEKEITVKLGLHILKKINSAA